MNELRIAVLASGRGSNFQAIAESIKKGTCSAQVAVLITNNPDAKAISIAKAYGIPVEMVDKTKFPDRESFDDFLLTILDRYEVDLVVLAGYMLLLKGKNLLEKYKNKIINIHPSLLPKFPGADAQKQAFAAGEKVSGFTIHFVDASLDGGPIIYQEKVDISDCKSGEEVSAKIIKHEHQAYPKIIDSFSKGKYVIEGKNVRFEPGN
ncbi:phosphoribosylglycinamide formyltransferase [Candidatus Micrarchaeota archaeon]|nr:phosphoribosylglycinamide formyltransferase [Candidatus Micrarchaeota archaeon]